MKWNRVTISARSTTNKESFIELVPIAWKREVGVHEVIIAAIKEKVVC